MKKLSVKALVEFRGKSERSKKIFVEKMKSTKIESPAASGGDYWVTSFSAVCNSYKNNDLTIIDQKIEELKDRITSSVHTISKNMYQKNIANLLTYKELDLNKLRPSGKLSFLKKSSADTLLTLRGLQIQTKPSHIFSFGKDDENVGAIWFTAIKDGYRIDQVGMFCEMLYKFLRHNYSKEYRLFSKFCVAVDLVSGQAVNFGDIESGVVAPLITPTLSNINRLI
jgi:hypothetical protein